MSTAIKKFIQSRVDDAFYTPDAAMIQRRDWHPLFVYGTLREGFCRDEFLSDCPKVGTGFTRGTNWRMWNLIPQGKFNPYPVILPCINQEHEGRVYGEVYLVSPKTLRTLDYIESNGINYRRTSRVIDINSKPTPSVMTCWVYMGEPASWKRSVDTGCLTALPRHTQKIKGFPYYIYKKSDAVSASMRHL